MELHSLPALSLPSLVHDALVVVGVGGGVALFAGFVFVNVGLLLPGLFTWLDRRRSDLRGADVAFGPAAAPTSSAPAPRQAAQLETNPDPQTVARPHLWLHLSGVATTSLASPIDAVTP